MITGGRVAQRSQVLILLSGFVAVHLARTFLDDYPPFHSLIGEGDI